MRFRSMTRGRSAGFLLAFLCPLVVLGEVAQSRAEVRDSGPCRAGGVLSAGEYCSHQEGANDFRFSVAGRKACIDGTMAAGVGMKVSACAESDELRFLDFLASERSGRWTVRSLPRSAKPQTGKKTPAAAWEAPWADPEFPQIDYGRPVFRKYHKWSRGIFGWWILGQDEAAEVVIAVNVSAVEEHFPDLRMQETLRVECHKGNVMVILYGGEPHVYLDAPLATYRFGNSSPVDEVWEKSRKVWSVGVGGSKALEFVRKIRLHEGSDLFIGARSEPDDELKEITFSLLGARKMVGAVAEHCPGLKE